MKIMTIDWAVFIAGRVAMDRKITGFDVDSRV